MPADWKSQRTWSDCRNFCHGVGNAFVVFSRHIRPDTDQARVAESIITLVGITFLPGYLRGNFFLVLEYDVMLKAKRAALGVRGRS